MFEMHIQNYSLMYLFLSASVLEHKSLFKQYGSQINQYLYKISLGSLTWIYG